MINFLRRLLPPASDERLEHGSVYLRPPRDSDWQAWSDLRRDSQDFLKPWEPAWSQDALGRTSFRQRQRHYTEKWRKGTGYSFFIFRTDDDALLGGISLTNIRRGVALSGTLGYWMGEPFARKGYMTEALLCILKFALERLGLHRVEAACLPTNTASRGLLEKCGFHEEGFAPKYLKINGVWSDHVLFAILREELEQAKPQPSPQRSGTGADAAAGQGYEGYQQAAK